MRVTFILADFAQVAEGKLNVLGAGWSFVGPEPYPSAIAGIIEVPWSDTNQIHELQFRLLDADGRPVEASDGSPIALDTEFEVGRPPGHPVATPVNFPFAFNIGPIQLGSGQRYQWELTLNGESNADWSIGFSTRRTP